MAGGPISPISQFPGTAGSTFEYPYSGGGGNTTPVDFGMGVAASLAADGHWYLRFVLPPSIPSGTAKLYLWAVANASSGVAKLTVKDAVVASGSSPSAASLTSETQVSITWTAADIYMTAKVSLTPTMVADEMLVVDLDFNSTSWTLAAVSVWYAVLIWE